MPSFLRRSNTIAKYLLRRLSAKERVLPDCVIIGAQKCGTSALYDRIARHSAYRPSLVKEVHYFDLNYRRGLSWYRPFFPQAEPGVHGLEASPYYLFHPLVAERVAHDLPQARFIALLRDPVARAWSHYHHNLRQGSEPLSFTEALEREPERLRGERERLIANPDAHSHAYQHFSYCARGEYADQIAGWLRHVPRERLLVVRYEDLVRDDAETFFSICRFLGIAEEAPPVRRVKEPGGYQPLDPVLRDRLRAHFAPHNRRLAELLGRDFGWDAT